MSTDFTAAMIAGLVAGNLQQIDESTTQRSSTGLAKKINPHNFLNTQPQAPVLPVHQDTVMQQHIPVSIVQEPVSIVQEQEPVSRTTASVVIPNNITLSNSDTAEILKTLVDLVSFVGSIDKTLKKIATTLKDNNKAV